ncbi:MAG: lysostaphin resistance A-like protein, partial [Acidimicrobiales bacterium]
AGLLAGSALLSRLRGTGRLGADVGLRLRPVDLVVGAVAGAVASRVLVALVYLPLERCCPDLVDRVDDEARELVDLAQGPGLLLLAVLTVVGAPLVEEIFFRGVLQVALVRRLGAVAGVGVASVAFALVHFQALQFPALVLFGVVAGTLAHRAGRLGPAVVTHVAFNGIAVAALLIDSGS